MKKLTYLTLLCAVVIVGLLTSPVMAVINAPGEPIYRPFNGAQERPDIDGDMIVWEDDRYDEQKKGVKDIFLATVDDFRSTPPYTYVGTRITDDPASQEKPSISGDYIAWQDNRHGNWDIYLYRRSTNTATQLTTDPGNQWLPIVRGNYIAWYDDSSGRTNIVLYDIAAGAVKDVIDVNAKTTIPGGSTEFKPALSEQYVAWVEPGDVTVHTYDKVYYYDIAAGRIVGPIAPTLEGDPLPSISQSWPSLSGSFIAWEDTLYRMDPDIYIADIHDPAEGRMHITRNDFDQVSPAIDGGIIVWEDKQIPERSIFMCDLFAVGDFQGEEMCLVEAEDREDAHLYPAVSGNTIVWQRGRGPNSNLCIFVYQPDAAVERVVTNIDVTPPTATLNVGETEPFSALARDQFGLKLAGVTFTWTSDDATVGTIDDTGRFTAKAAGTATVTATAGNVSGTATVTVNAEEPGEPVLDRIEVTPETPTLEIDGTQQFTATAFDQFEDEMIGVAFSWSCDNETVGTIDNSTGLFTAKAEGTADVVATAGSVSGTATVTVSAEEPVAMSIEVAPPTPTLEVDGTVTFEAAVHDQFGNPMPGIAVNWSCSDTAVGTIDESSGLFTALTAGTATVTASAGDASGETTVTVTVNEWPLLAKIAVVPSAATLETGDELEFSAVAFDRFGNIVEDAEITWECSDTCIGTIDECGVFTALDGGTATITACGDGAEGTATVTVNCGDPVLSRIVVTPAAITLAAGDTAAFTATAFDQDGCEMPDVEIAWECSDDTVGEVDDTGFFAALAAGPATVTATSGGVTGAADVEVTDESTGVVVSPSAIILDCGDEWQFNADVYDLQDNAGSIVTWSCVDPGIGTITDDGLFTACGEGSTSVTATVAGENETVTGTATVTVRSTASELARIEVSPSDFCIPAGNCLTLTARGFDQYGLPMDVDVDWKSSDPCVGEIDLCSGAFTALAEGEVTLIASADGVSGSACVTVEPSIPVPDCIEVEPPETTLTAGGNREFTATVFDQRDNEMDWVRVAWSCSDDDVGTIDRSGLFAAISQGSTDVTACAGGVERTASVTVTAAPTTDPTLEPTQTPTNPGSNNRAYSDGGGDPGPSFFAGICEDLKSGETHTFSGIDVTSVGSIAVTASGNIPRLLMTVKETGCPNLAEPPGSSTYEYVEIATSWANPNQIGGATLTFTIPAKWLDEHGMAPEDVRLMRYVDGGWQILETEVVGEENGLYRFRATTPGFSTFAIAASPSSLTASAEEIDVTPDVTGTPGVTEEVTTEPTTAVPTTTTPAAPLIYAPLLAPLAFLLWGRRKN